MLRIAAAPTLSAILATAAALLIGPQATGSLAAQQQQQTQHKTPDATERIPPAEEGLLATERLQGEGVWLDPKLKEPRSGTFRVVVWFDRQLLGDGGAYARRAEEFATARRRELRDAAVKTLKELSQSSYSRAEESLNQLVADNSISNLERHWIINGFSCTTTSEALTGLCEVPGVKYVFFKGPAQRFGNASRRVPSATPDPDADTQKASGESAAEPETEPTTQPEFAADRYQHPWYVHSLLVDKVWTELKVTGQGTLNVIHDGNFVVSPSTLLSQYQNPGETAGDGQDNDTNGLVDDVHGYDFDRDSGQLTRLPAVVARPNPPLLHGHACASVICGQGTEQSPYEFGIAPRSKWAGVLASERRERAIEWAVEQHADTYSMSFSIPNQDELRSHWRKMMEHGSFCGVFFVSGAGNFAIQGRPTFAPIPIQMRTPEDIPSVVFAAAGVQRDLSRTPFSSQGPVEWQTHHYHDGRVPKPEVCAFNMNLPGLNVDGTLLPMTISGNSFAGPMFCGTIALMLSADPDLLPWDLRQIVTETAMDVGEPGVDSQTGHGLINAYRAVRETLRRKAVRHDRVDWTSRRGRAGCESASPGTEEALGHRARAARAAGRRQSTEDGRHHLAFRRSGGDHARTTSERRPSGTEGRGRQHYHHRPTRQGNGGTHPA